MIVYLTIGAYLMSEINAVFNPQRNSLTIKSWTEAASVNNTVDTSLPEAPIFVMGWKLTKNKQMIASDPSTVQV